MNDPSRSIKSTSKAIKLVVNCDDVCYSTIRDQGITTAATRGAITSGSALVNGTDAQQCFSLLRLGYPDFRLGLHVNLTEGTPVCPPGTIPSLVGTNQQFLGKMGLRKAILNDRIHPEHVLAEIRAQMIKFVQLHGHVPSHMDGHQHVHVIPFIAPLFAAIAKESDVRWVRMPLDSGIPNTSSQRLASASTHSTANLATSAPTHPGVQPPATAAGSPTVPPRVSITWVEAERMRFYEEVCRNARTAAPIFIQHGLRFADEFVGLGLMGRDATVERAKALISAAAASALRKARLNNTVRDMMGPGSELRRPTHPTGSCSDRQADSPSPDLGLMDDSSIPAARTLSVSNPGSPFQRTTYPTSANTANAAPTSTIGSKIIEGTASLSVEPRLHLQPNEETSHEAPSIGSGQSREARSFSDVTTTTPSWTQTPITSAGDAPGITVASGQSRGRGRGPGPAEGRTRSGEDHRREEEDDCEMRPDDCSPERSIQDTRRHRGRSISCDNLDQHERIPASRTVKDGFKPTLSGTAPDVAASASPASGSAETTPAAQDDVVLHKANLEHTPSPTIRAASHEPSSLVPLAVEGGAASARSELPPRGGRPTAPGLSVWHSPTFTGSTVGSLDDIGLPQSGLLQTAQQFLGAPLTPGTYTPGSGHPNHSPFRFDRESVDTPDQGGARRLHLLSIDEDAPVVEVMVHVGYSTPADVGGCGGGPDEFAMSDDRRHEFDIWTDPEFVAWLDANFDLSAFDTRFAYGRASRLSARSSRASLSRSVDVLDKAGSAGGSPRPQML